jgi:dTMP kinase
VIADRYSYTAIARGTVRGLPRAYCEAACSFAARPDLVLHLRLPVAVTLDRRLRTGRTIAGYVSGSDFLTGGDERDRFLRYQTLLDESYSNQLPAAHQIDAMSTPDAVWHQVLAGLDDLRSGVH